MSTSLEEPGILHSYQSIEYTQNLQYVAMYSRAWRGFLYSRHGPRSVKTVPKDMPNVSAFQCESSLTSSRAHAGDTSGVERIVNNEESALSVKQHSADSSRFAIARKQLATLCRYKSIQLISE